MDMQTCRWTMWPWDNFRCFERVLQSYVGVVHLKSISIFLSATVYWKSNSIVFIKRKFVFRIVLLRKSIGSFSTNQFNPINGMWEGFGKYVKAKTACFAKVKNINTFTKINSLLSLVSRIINKLYLYRSIAFKFITTNSSDILISKTFNITLAIRAHLIELARTSNTQLGTTVWKYVQPMIQGN